VDASQNISLLILQSFTHSNSKETVPLRVESRSISLRYSVINHVVILHIIYKTFSLLLYNVSDIMSLIVPRENAKEIAFALSLVLCKTSTLFFLNKDPVYKDVRLKNSQYLRTL